MPRRDVDHHAWGVCAAGRSPRPLAHAPAASCFWRIDADQGFDLVARWCGEGAHASVLELSPRGGSSSAPLVRLSTTGATWIATPACFEHRPVLVGQAGIDHDLIDLIQPAQPRQGQPAKLGVVGDDHDFLPARHHLPLGLDQERIRVVDPLGHDPARPQDGRSHPDRLHRGDRQRPERHARSRVDVAADQDQVGLLARSQKLRDRQAVGDDLDAPADQGPGDLERRRAAVEQDRVAVFEQGRRRQADGPLLGGRRARSVRRRPASTAPRPCRPPRHASA